MASATLSPDMTKFLKAMHNVYKFPTPSTTSTSLQWIPPPASAGHKGRYLWTDAFGVLNFLTLFKETSDPYFLSLSKTLVSAVHDTLGRTRDGRSRLPNATDSTPLAGGLRIGKEEESGPDGDGQYHHYLTLWMFALNRLSLASNQKEYNDLAIQLAKAIHPHFMYNRDSARPRMYWKMNMDLSHPLVRSEGYLDPIDGLVIFRLLQQTDDPASRVLEKEIEEYDRIVRVKWENYESRDPLDLGMTMWTAHFFGIGEEKERWSEHLLNATKRDMKLLFDVGYFEQSTKRRLAFREFGTVLGMRTGADGEEWENRVKKVIENWEETGLVPDPSEKKVAAGRNAEIDLLPITMVMYATALNPCAFKKEYLI